MILNLVAALLSTQTAMATAGLCGSLDLRSTPNEMIERVVYVNDLQNARRNDRTQCGLAGESLKICSACSEGVPEKTMAFLRPILGEPSHLKWHSAWHKLRATKEIDADFFKKAQDKGHIETSQTLATFLQDHAGAATKSGEDFFYMHRLMIKMVQVELAGAGLPCIAGWSTLPSSIDDSNWPVPKNFGSKAVHDDAQKQLDTFKEQLTKLRDPARLRKISLNRLGQIVEPTLHQGLHNLYRSTRVCSPEAAQQGFCDDLLPVETSPLNKHFWKIHGLVDDLIGDWLRAHSYKEISTDCQSRSSCYQWKGTWVGRYPKS